jgi:ABC-type glycerol-3-phosphate transport system substrate-binding protein
LEFYDLLPEVKDSLAYFKKWLEEGCINPDYITVGWDSWSTIFVNGRSGCFFFNASLFKENDLIDKMKEMGQIWTGAPIPTGKQGRYLPGARPAGGMVAISKEFKKPEVLVKMLDSMCADEEWRLMVKRGIEGVVWEDKDGKIVTDNEQNGLHTFRHAYMMAFPSDWEDLEQIERDGGSYWENFQYQLMPDSLADAYYGEQFDELVDFNARFKPARDEVYLQIIFGAKPIDEFDTFREKWLKEAQPVLEKVNKWYKDRQ